MSHGCQGACGEREPTAPRLFDLRPPSAPCKGRSFLFRPSSGDFPTRHRLWFNGVQSTTCRGVDKLENLLLPAIIACACSLLLSGAACLYCLAFSSPASLRKEVDGVRIQVEAALQQNTAIAAGFLAHKTEMASIEESVEGMLDAVERKRRSTAASASKLLTASEERPMTRDEIKAAARHKVYGVS